MNRHPGASAWRRAQHWQTAPPWAPRGRPPPRICTSSSSSWRPSHPWGRGTALWCLLRVTCRYPDLRQARISRVYPPWLPTISRETLISIQRRTISACRCIRDRFATSGRSYFLDLSLYALANLTVSRFARAGKFIPDFSITENIIDRKRGSLAKVLLFLGLGFFQFLKSRLLLERRKHLDGLRGRFVSRDFHHREFSFARGTS